MEKGMSFECVATFRNEKHEKRRVTYKVSLMKTAYRDGLVEFEKNSANRHLNLGSSYTKSPFAIPMN
jgi:hypothetical protein